VIALKLDDLFTPIRNFRKVGDGNPEITSIENDARAVQVGSLFICIKGYTVDGHDLAEEAVKKGAVAVVADHLLSLTVPVVLVPDCHRVMALLANIYYKSPTSAFKLVGVTGTNGKTSIAEMTEQIMEKLGAKTGLIGTRCIKINQQAEEAKMTTPESLTLQKHFANMREAQVECAIMEVSSHALELGRVHGCDFDIAVFTNLTSDHLDFHGTMDNYKLAKSLLFSQLGTNPDKLAILNADEEDFELMKMVTQAQIVTYGLQAVADFFATDVQQSIKGTTFTLHTSTGCYPVQSNLIGTFNVYNLLAVIAICVNMELDIQQVIAAIAELETVSGRFEIIDEGQDFLVIVDYSHTPDSLEKALLTIKEFASKRIFTVIGCGGERDRMKRPIMAQVACELSDVAIFTMDNPRAESQDVIFQDMEDGVRGYDYQVIADRREAIEYAVRDARCGDIILIAGKGHEKYQIIGKEKLCFDDCVVARAAIKAR